LADTVAREEVWLPRRATPKPRRLPRVPLPRQTGGRHEDKTRRPWRDRKHKKREEP
jgi:hypothetical protein